MTANADTGATRADTTGNGATSHDATNQSRHQPQRLPRRHR